MSDILAPLREPEPVTPPAPEEVRRRGDRLRRRRTGLAALGAVCVTAIVVGGTALLVGDPTGSGSAPGPVDSPTSEEVELDLADGLPRLSTTSSADAPELLICGEKFSLTDRATASEGVSHEVRGDFTDRSLSVYPDAATARAATADLVAELRACPRFTDDRGRVWTTSVQPTSDGDQGWMVGRFADAPGPRVDFPEAIQIVRLGASLLVVHQREVHGVPAEDLAAGTRDQVEWLLHRQLCLLTDEGCAWRSDPDVLRPDGWGPLRLGMSRADVEAATGAEPGEAGDCTVVDLGPGTGFLSESDGLVSIQVPESVITPDSIGSGSSRDEVREQYPFVEATGEVVLVRASPTADYVITFEGDHVTQLALSTAGEECSG